ncbi:copper resistance protein CopC [Actinoallomurus sp. NPDC052308]|uniref:copper resistance CopC/CopD family protein n=1 Tax=Actinoallomurus sp. NPDC052308 TaxID=3155530 RepID=UPI0034457973
MRSAAPASRRVARLGASIGAAVLILVLAASPASAHATLSSSSPADGAIVSTLPSAVTLTFDEPVRPVAADVRVLDPTGTGVAGTVTGAGPKVTIGLRGSGAQGTYTLTWRVISADSHPVGGAIAFSAGHPSRPATARFARTDTTVSVLFAVMRFAGFLGFALFVGVLAFCWYGRPDAARRRGVGLLIVGGWAALVAGTFGSLLLQGPYAAGAGLGALVRPELISQTLATVYGRALTARLLILGCLPFLLAFGLARLGDGSRMRRLAFGGAGAIAAVGIAVTWSVGGHAATSSQPFVTVPADVAHLCAMALWLGGLAAVTVTMRT